MMSIMTARECKELVNNAGTHSALQAAIMTAILAAITAMKTSCTVDINGKHGGDVLTIKSSLVGMGYALSQSGTTLTISWA